MTPTPPRTDETLLLADVQRQLAQGHVLTLSCHDAQGCWAAPVFYAHAGLDLYFLSSPRSRHAAALAFDARCAGAIHAPAQRWQDIAGLQLAGTVVALDGEAAAQARQVYALRYPFVEGAESGDDALAQALRKSTCYRLRVDQLVLVDNTRGLGARRSWTRPAGGAYANGASVFPDPGHRGQECGPCPGTEVGRPVTNSSPKDPQP